MEQIILKLSSIIDELINILIMLVYLISSVPMFLTLFKPTRVIIFVWIDHVTLTGRLIVLPFAFEETAIIKFYLSYSVFHVA